MPESARSLAKRWIALLDAAEFLMESAHPRDPVAMRRVERAIDSLFTFEHTLDEAQRVLARTLLWQRDRGDLPSPERMATWGRCRCRHCLIVSRRAGIVPALAVPLAPASVPVLVAPEPPPTQGDLFSC